MHDSSQAVLANSGVVVEVLEEPLTQEKEAQADVPAVALPVRTTSEAIEDTSATHGREEVSFGYSYNFPSGSFDIKFAFYCLRTRTSVDERNLVSCRRLNFDGASITSLNTIFLKELRVLVLYNSKIVSLDTDNLSQLEYLSVGYTPLVQLSTKVLGKV